MRSEPVQFFHIFCIYIYARDIQETQHVKMQNTHLQDLQLDNPDAAHLLSLFLGRAIVDEALPPSFLAAVLPTLEDHSEGVNVVQSTGMETLRMYVAFYHSLCLGIQWAMLTSLLS